MTAARMCGHSNKRIGGGRIQNGFLRQCIWTCLSVLMTASAFSQPPPSLVPPVQEGPVTALYRALRTVKLDPARVYHVREATIDREDLRLWLTDGTVVFTTEVNGKITGMLFNGEGEVLLRPPNRTERASLGLFVDMGILEDKFSSAYFRFNDDTAEALKPFLRPPDETDTSLLSTLEGDIGLLAQGDALRLLTSFTAGAAKDTKGRALVPDRYLHARVAGEALGAYDIVYDSRAVENIFVGQAGGTEDAPFYDLWMSFPARSTRERRTQGVPALLPAESVRITNVLLKAAIMPPQDLAADADLDLTVEQGGARVLLFELSRNLHVSKVTQGDTPLEIIQNDGVPGGQLARRGNDIVAVVLAQPCVPGQLLHLHFTYQGAVLSAAGGGLFYVGARGNWYPNRGLEMAHYDLRFTYPRHFSLVATGKRVEEGQEGDNQTGRWVSERPYTVAGFNLGQYDVTEAQWKNGKVQAYTAHGMEKEFPTATQMVMTSRTRGSGARSPIPEINAFTMAFDPKSSAGQIANSAAGALDFFSQQFGPYPFSTLELTQRPGRESQGWPGLIFLSSYTYLNDEERAQLHMGDFQNVFYGKLMLPHEIAHQWWGHQVYWSSYRDQWICEALANYSALLLLEHQDPKMSRIILDGYRDQLLSETPEKRQFYQAGPVTLGARLNSSKFHEAYEVIAYGRGTWLFHMLRCMLNDERRFGKAKTTGPTGDELFLQVLQTLLKRHQNESLTTEDVRKAFEEVLPDSLRFEGRKSLDWFFDSWVGGTVIPRYRLRSVRFARQENSSLVTGHILQQEAPDDLVSSIPVYADSAGHLSFLGRVFAVGDETSFRFRAPLGTKKIVLDPYQTILSRP